MEQLLTIGEFAERCGLSRSALRFYDQNGLLRPQLVDSENGYRLYAVAQLETARLVRGLRSAEMPVGLLREFLAASPSQRRAILEQHSASFRQRAEAVHSAVSELRAALGGADLNEPQRWCKLAPGAFAEALNQVSFAVADPAVRAELGAVWVETKEDSLRLVATDSYRMAVRDLLPDRIGPAPLRGVIDAAHAHRLAAELADAGALVLTQSGDGTVTAVVDAHATEVGGSGEGFPDYERILDGLPEGSRIALGRRELEQAIASLDTEANEVSLGFREDMLVLATGEDRVSVPGSWPAQALMLFLNPRFFADAVAATVGPDVIIEAVSPLQPVTLRSADTGTFSVLTMPVHPPGQA